MVFSNKAAMSPNYGTAKIINIPFETNEKFITFRCLNTLAHYSILKIWTPEIITVIVQKMKQFAFLLQ